MLRTAVQMDLSPDDFWNMTMSEYYEIVEMNLGKQGLAGTSITEDRLEQLQAWADTVRAERDNKNVNSTDSPQN